MAKAPLTPAEPNAARLVGAARQRAGQTGERALVIPVVLTAIMFAALIALGIWQLHRLSWKRGILAEIDRAEAAPPIPLPPLPAPFQKVAITGRFAPGPIAYYTDDVRDTPQGPRMGSRLIQPLMRTDGLPILIDRGWAPADANPPTPEGTVTLQAYVRPADHPRLFTPKDDPATRHIYTLDPAAIAPLLGLPKVAPFTLILLADQPSQTYPLPATILPRPANDHLSYALTWFGLAVVLVGIFIAWLRMTLRLSRGATEDRGAEI